MDTTATWHKLEEAITAANQDSLGIATPSKQGIECSLYMHYLLI